MHRLLALEVIVYGFAWWLGLYLLARDHTKPLLRLAGLGLLAYAGALATDVLRTGAPPPLATALARIHWLLLALPALLWAGAMLYLLPEETPLRPLLLRGWRLVFLPGAALCYVLGAATDIGLSGTAEAPQIGPAYLALAALALLPLLAGLVLVARTIGTTRTARPRRMLCVAALFFFLGTAMVLFPLNWLSRMTAVLSVGGDLVLLGLTIAVLDAFDEGETLLPDITRSFTAALLAALLFGVLVALATSATGPSPVLLALLLATIGAAIALQTLATPLQLLLDRLVFANAPGLRQARADLRATVDVLPRVDPAPDFQGLDEAELVRLTRRALSHYGDLPRLAGSPLTRAPTILARLAARGAQDDALEGAAELKTLLDESIARLKPRGKGDFGTSDEWRYYNALYFPYVVGIKPYSRRSPQHLLDPVAQQAMAWFQSSVPERTLYNWQTAAARLVAQELNTRLQEEGRSPPAPAGQLL